MPKRIDVEQAIHAAQVALDSARGLPGGQERFEALKHAGLLRARATSLLLEIEKIERDRLLAIKQASS